MKLFQLTTDTFSMFISPMQTKRFNSFATNHFQTASKAAVLLIAVYVVIGTADTACGKAINRQGIASAVFDDRLLNPDLTYGGESGLIEWQTSGGTVRERKFEFTALDGESPTLNLSGDWQVDSFFDIAYQLDFEVDNGPLESYTGVGTARVVGTAPGGVEPRVFAMELLSLDLDNSDAPTPFLLRESPTLASPGTTIITSLPGGLFDIDSFFDIETELSLDGGQTWTAAVAQVPEPSSLLLAGLGLIGIVGFRFRRRSERFV